jgi:hypothetical protein
MSTYNLLGSFIPIEVEACLTGMSCRECQLIIGHVTFDKFQNAFGSLNVNPDLEEVVWGFLNEFAKGRILEGAEVKLGYSLQMQATTRNEDLIRGHR